VINVVQINYTFDRGLVDPEALLALYPTLTGWSDALSAAGARVTVVQRFHRRAIVERGDVTYIFTPSPIVDLARMRSRIDLAHVNGLIFPARTWALRQALPSPRPIVIQDHGSLPFSARRWFTRGRRRVRRWMLGAADAFLFASMEQGDAWKAAGLVAPRQRIYDVMPASTSFAPVPRDRARASSGISGSPAILWVGRLNANKDPLTVLNGFERCLATTLPGATLTMVFSERGLLPAVRARVEVSSLLRERVRLVGAIAHHDLPSFYSSADLFVVGSHHEGSGYALIEACACGATPVVTDIPSFRAITGRGAIGALWQAGDAAGFAHALAAAGAKNLEAARAASLRHFERALSWPVVGCRALEIYRDVASTRSATHGLAAGR
jgi:glycosyltransferase involved in cell wall biosynthesis